MCNQALLLAGRSPWMTVVVSAFLFLIAGTASAQLTINGVSQGQVVDGEITISASAEGRVTGLTLQLVGPNGFNITARTDRSWTYLTTDPSKPWEPMPWDASTQPEGEYTVIAHSYSSYRTGRRMSTSSLKFTVKHAPVADEATATTATTEAAPVTPQDAVDEGDSLLAVAESPAVTEPISFRLANGLVTERTIGDSSTFDMVVTGDMASNEDLLVIAWDNDRHRLVDNFAYVMDAAPYRLTASQLDTLPTGSVEVQVHHRIDDKIVKTLKHTIEVLAKPEPTADEMPYVDFTTEGSTSFTKGSAQGLSLTVDGTMPEGGDVLVQAWSVEESKLVSGFAHELSAEPWTVQASALNKLPLGLNEVQLLSRFDGKVVAKATKTVSVSGTSQTDDGTTDGGTTDGSDQVADGGDGGSTDTDTDTDSGTDADGGTDSGTDAVAVDVRFASGTPSQYQQGSGTPIALSLTGTLPDGADILMLTWSVSQSQMVSGFAHELTSAPFVVSNSKLDSLPTGAAELQALLRVPGEAIVIRKFPITIVGPDGTVDEEEDTDDATDDDADYGDVALTSAGFTAFTKSSDTQVIYVAANGNDSNNGLSTSSPVKTPKRGYELLRDGKPDWLLFKAGDTFSGNIGEWKKSGRGVNEKILVGVYGEGDRPLMMTPSDNWARKSFGDAVKHVAFVGLHFYAYNRDPNRSGFVSDASKRSSGVLNQGAIVFLGKHEDLLVEDCLLEYFKFALVFQSGDYHGYMKNINVRRTIVRNCYGHWDSKYGGHSSGMYVEKVQDMLIEECVFDHNGWNTKVGGANRTKFNHNIYVQSNSSRVNVKNSIMARGSSHGLQLRGGGDVENNLFVKNAIAFFVAQGPSIASLNVVLQSDDIASDAQRGGAIGTLHCEHAQILNNIVSQRESTNTNSPAIGIFYDGATASRMSGKPYKVTIKGNKVYKWPFSGGKRAINIGTSSATVLADTGNLLDKASGGSSDPAWIDPSRDVASYMKSIGQTASLEAFLNKATSRPRGQWAEAYSADAVNDYIRKGFDVLPYD